MFIDKWDCKTCMEKNRRKSFQCHRRSYSEDIIRQREKKSPREPGEPEFIYSIRIGDCPWNHVTGFSTMFSQARQWWENGQLGVSYLDAPWWFVQALGVAGSAGAKAREYKRQTEK